MSTAGLVCTSARAWPFGKRIKAKGFRSFGQNDRTCHVLEHGINILVKKTVPSFLGRNYPSLTECPEKVRAEIERWEKLKIFEYVDSRPHVVNSLGAVFKNNKTRLIVDCTASGLNNCLWSPKFKLPSIQSAIRKMQRNSWQMTIDLEDGFFHLLIDPSEVDLLGFRHPLNNRWARFRFLPFGLRSAPLSFLYPFWKNSSDCRTSRRRLPHNLRGRLAFLCIK